MSRKEAFIQLKYDSKTAAMNRVRILVVEDDLDIRFLIQSTLSCDPSLEVIGGTTTAIGAVALALEGAPALVILDHQIEGQIMGLQAAPIIKAVVPGTRIILFTSENLADEVSREPAIDIYLPKTDLQELLPTARRLLQLEQLV